MSEIVLGISDMIEVNKHEGRDLRAIQQYRSARRKRGRAAPRMKTFAERKSITIVGSFVDRAISGREAENRLEFQRMI